MIAGLGFGTMLTGAAIAWVTCGECAAAADLGGAFFAAADFFHFAEAFLTLGLAAGFLVPAAFGLISFFCCNSNAGFGIARS